VRGLAAGLLSLLAAAGCMTGAGRDATPGTVHRQTSHLRDGTCLADWNAAHNRLVREQTVPPTRPYLLYGGIQHATPIGDYQVFVHRSIVIGAVGTNPPPVCYIYFRFPRGYHGGPAMVSYPEIHPARGVYGDPSITFGNDTDVGGRVFAQRPDGTLFPTDRTRRS
jgi:hypothetical protein